MEKDSVQGNFVFYAGVPLLPWEAGGGFNPIPVGCGKMWSRWYKRR